MTADRSVMLAYPFCERRLSRWRKPFLMQPKFDGIRCQALITDIGDRHYSVSLRSSQMNPIFSCPHIVSLLKTVAYPSSSILLDGELYVHGWKFEEISGPARRETPDEQSQCLQFHIFSAMYDPEDDEFHRCHQASFLAAKLNSSHIREVNTLEGRDMADIENMLQYCTAHGFEGIMLKEKHVCYSAKRSTSWMKLKPRQTDCYLITGVVQEYSQEGTPKGTLGSLELIDDNGQHFHVGTGFTFDQRVRLWLEREKLPGKKAVIKYQELTAERKVPRFPVLVEVV